MARFETWFSVNLNKAPQVQTIHGNVFTQDNMGNLVGVRVMKGNAEATLTGAVLGYVIREDGKTVVVNGERNGNTAYIVLPESAYAVPGRIQIAIRLISGSTKTVLLAAIGYVTRTTTGTIIDPGEVIPSLEELLAKLDDMDDAIAAAEQATSDAQDATDELNNGMDSIIKTQATQPTEPLNKVWVDTSTTVLKNLPEVKDNEISAVDTWSSQKINAENADLKSAIGETTSEYKPLWDRGTIDTTTGEVDGNTKRVKEVEFLLCKSIVEINVENGCYFGCRFYDANKEYITEGYTGFQNTSAKLSDLNTFNATYVRFVGRNSGNTTISDPADVSDNIHIIVIEPLTDRLTKIENTLSNRYYTTYEAVEVPQGIDKFVSTRLSLVATKKNNWFSADEPTNTEGRFIASPNDIGYLYLDVETSRFYYSANRWDRPQYLFTWNRSVTDDNTSPNNWCPIITKAGDIVFLKQGKHATRSYPIVYKHGDYNNPVQVQVTNGGYKPAGMNTDTNAVVSFQDDFILFAEYAENGHPENNGEPLRIWKISGPNYHDPSNWAVKLTKYRSSTDSRWGQDTDNEIAHWHTVCLDHYSGYYYANSGDGDDQVRTFVSKDKGETWTEYNVNGQKYRTLGYVFNADGAYWGTDASSNAYHNLYFAARKDDGEINFASSTIVANCHNITGQAQRTYNSCMCRNPNGILLIDRAEPRSDGLLYLDFYSFDDQTMHLVDILHATSSDTSVQRWGFGQFAATYYQSTEADGIIVGGMPYDRRMSLDMLNSGSNSKTRVGVTKITIHEMVKPAN